MGKVLTPFQDRVLLLLFDLGLGSRDYFFTGGSALAEFYLQHRESDDLDLFTRVDRNLKADFEDLKPIIASEGLEIMEQSAEEQFVRFFLHNPAPGESDLKVELARDAKAQMAPSKVVGKVIVDSFEDISVNKVCAILGREPPERKDFVDLYFILRESSFSLDYLVARAREKEAAFDNEDGILAFATNLLRFKELAMKSFIDSGRIIKTVTLSDLEEVLLPRAEAIIQRLRPKTT